MECRPLDNALAAIKASAVDEFAQAKARAMITGYDRRYLHRFSQVEIIGVESEFRFRLLNPETEAPSRTFDDAGKIDVHIRENGQRKVVEHKTNSESLDPDSDYWDRLRMDTQVSKYFLASEVIGEPAEVVLYDVLRKPMLQATAVPTLDGNGLKQIVNAIGQRVMTKDGKRWKQTCTEEGESLLSRPMTPDEYYQKLINDIESRPEYYFAQREVARLDSELREYMNDAWACGQQILIWRRMGVWPRNPNACQQMGGCEFFGLCSGRAEVDGINYRQRLGAVNAELSEELQKQDDRELLTASRMYALRRCARYHFHKYEEPIERVGGDAEALAFGQVIHAALEAWFKAIKLNQEAMNNGNGNSPISEQAAGANQ